MYVTVPSTALHSHDLCLVSVTAKWAENKQVQGGVSDPLSLDAPNQAIILYSSHPQDIRKREKGEQCV